jgi:hypothetical protein
LVELDFFSWLNAKPSDLRAICQQFAITERPADVMLTLFKAMGFVEEKSGVFNLTALAREHLVKDSPWFLGPYYAALKDRPVCKDFLRVLRTGKPATWGSFKDEKAWTEAMEDPAFAHSFTAAMDCRGVFLGRALAQAIDWGGRSRLLDVAGGSGIYACCVAAAQTHIRATVFEKPPVDKVAARAIAERGFSERVSVIAGDMLRDKLPGSHDVHLISNVLHDWDVPVVRQLLASSSAALPAGGLLIVHDAYLNAEKTGPLHVAEYSTLLMHSTEGKCYSVREMEGYLRDCGFIDVKFKPTAAARGIVTARKP